MDLDQLTDADRATIHRAAETGRTAAVGLMLDLGFPVEARGDNGGTPLHAAAYAGNAAAVGSCWIVAPSWRRATGPGRARP